MCGGPRLEPHPYGKGWKTATFMPAAEHRCLEPGEKVRGIRADSLKNSRKGALRMFDELCGIEQWLLNKYSLIG